MRSRSEPVFATWLLKLFCSGPEHEPLIGDLIEQYRERGGRFWYWRQVIGIVRVEICRGATWNIRRQPGDRHFRELQSWLRETHAPAKAGIDSSRIPMSGGLGPGILIAAMLAAVLHDLPLLRVMVLPGILAGLLLGVLFRVWGRLHPRDIKKEWLSIK